MKEIVKEILCEIKGDESIRNKITPSTDILNEIGLDSIQMVDLMLQIEERLNLEIDFDQFSYEHMRSSHDFCNFLQQQKTTI